MLEHKDEIKIDVAREGGFKNIEDFFEKIQKDTQDAAWCLTELLDWGMTVENLDNEFIHEIYTHTEEFSSFPRKIYKVLDEKTLRYFKIDHKYSDTHKYWIYIIKEVKPTIKLVEVKTWEEI